MTSINRIGKEGVPPTFYLMAMLTKMSLAGCAVGTAVAWRHRRQRGYVFLRVMIVFQIIGYSMMAAKFIRYRLPLLMNLLAAAGIVASLRWLTSAMKSGMRDVALPVAYGALAVMLFVASCRRRRTSR